MSKWRSWLKRNLSTAPLSREMATIGEVSAEGLRKGSGRMSGLKEMPKVGDKVRCLKSENGGRVTSGHIYEVIGLDSDGDAYVLCDNNRHWIVSYRDALYGNYELVTEPSQEVSDLIANLGRRLSEVEVQLERTKEREYYDNHSESYPKYFKDVSGIDRIDVYKTHELFGIDDPSGAIQHASKKLLLSGERTGGKSKFTDIKEARDTLSRWLEINAMEAEQSE